MLSVDNETKAIAGSYFFVFEKIQTIIPIMIKTSIIPHHIPALKISPIAVQPLNTGKNANNNKYLKFLVILFFLR